MRPGLKYFLILLFGAVLLSLPVAGCGGDEGSGTGEDGDAVGGTPIETGLPEVRLLKPGATGAGEIPAFEWEPVDGAKTYRLVLVDAGSKPVWSWEGEATSVKLGGLSVERPADVSGPIITPNSVWSVSAFDSDGKPVAVSVLRPVSP